MAVLPGGSIIVTGQTDYYIENPDPSVWEMAVLMRLDARGNAPPFYELEVEGEDPTPPGDLGATTYLDRYFTP